MRKIYSLVLATSVLSLCATSMPTTVYATHQAPPPAQQLNQEIDGLMRHRDDLVRDIRRLQPNLPDPNPVRIEHSQQGLDTVRRQVAGYEELLHRLRHQAPPPAQAQAVPFQERQVEYDNNGRIVQHTIRVFQGEDQRAVVAKKGEAVAITELKRRQRLPGDLDTRNMTDAQIQNVLGQVSISKGNVSTSSIKNLFK